MMLSRSVPVAKWFTTLAVCATGGVRAGMVAPAFVSHTLSFEKSLSLRLLNRGIFASSRTPVGVPRMSRGLSAGVMGGYRMQQGSSPRLQITGKILEIMPEQTFQSGNRKREFVVTTNEMYSQQIKFDLWGDKISLLETVQVDDHVIVNFNMKGSKYNGKYYVNLVAWRLQKVEVEDSGHMGGGGTLGMDMAGFGSSSDTPQFTGGSRMMSNTPISPQMHLAQESAPIPKPPPFTHALGNPRDTGTWDGSFAAQSMANPGLKGKREMGWDQDMEF